MTEPQDFIRGITMYQWLDAIGQGDVVGRAEMAERMEVSYSTAIYHLERLVEHGLLNKAWGFVGNQPAWVYALPQTMPRLEKV